MLLTRYCILLSLVLFAACKQIPKAGGFADSPQKIKSIYITRRDAGMKSICLDSSGFYYLCCDSVNAPDASKRRYNLVSYNDELSLFKSLNTQYFDRLDKSVGVSCGVAKEPFDVLIKMDDGGEYNFHPGICSSYTSESSFYKMQQVREFFIQLKTTYSASL